MVDIRNALVLIYIIIGYTLGIILLRSHHNLLLLSAGMSLLAHTLTWSTYMHHELCHNSVFDNRIWNIRFGRIMDWLNGACYWTFEELKKQHINHHIFKVDYDFKSEVLKCLEANRLFKYSLLLCEYFYFPLHSYIFQWRAILAPWWKNERKFARSRTIFICILRTIYFSLLCYVGEPSILVYYLIAYSISINIIRFTDAFSHSYETVLVGTRRKYLSKSYDMRHTYSIVWETDENTSVILRICAQLTHFLFFLNFNFHNQHHYATQKKWYELGPSFQFDNEIIQTNKKVASRKVDDINDEEYTMNHQPDEEVTMHGSVINPLFSVTKNHFTIPLSVALKFFHTHRINRVFGQSTPPVLEPTTKRLSLENCFGVTDASILVLEV